MQRSWLSGRTGYVLAGIIVLAFFTYGGALNNLFIPFDDNTLIYMNPAVAHLSLRTLWFVFSSYDPELYIPLTFIVYQVIHLFAGFNAAAFHAASVLLHCVNIFLVAWIVWQGTKKQSVALIVAALFALHPLHSEVVLWAAAMKDVLSSTLGLLSLVLYMRSQETGSTRTWRWSIASFFLGLLAKVSIAPLPVLFLLVDWMQGKPLTRQSVQKLWPFFALTLVFVMIALAGKSSVIASVGFFSLVLLSFKATAFYVLKLLWPSNLSLLYPQLTLPAITDPSIIISIIAVLLLLAIACVMRKKYRWITGGILWFLILLVPSFTAFYKNEHLYFASARYAYLPSIGLFLISAILAAALWKRFSLSRIPMAIAGAFIAVLFVVLTHAQALIWHDSTSLFGNVLRLYPDAVVAYNNYATSLTDPQEALPYFEKAIQLNPHFILAYRNIAGLQRKVGDSDKEKEIYERGIPMLLEKAHPTDDDLSLLFEYAEFLEKRGNQSGMFQALQQAIDLKPGFSESYYNLGVKREKYGQMEEAGKALEQALAISGDKADTLYHLASVYAQTGRLQEAADVLSRLVALNPNYPNAQRHLDAIQKMITN